jgi:hypothetical protein
LILLVQAVALRQHSLSKLDRVSPFDPDFIVAGIVQSNFQSPKDFLDLEITDA